ncbi:uncharacterized protein LOC125645446 isoform X2 [Ostrea edulis]|uniref:uncharacterized protein LOC125645446 isoform X2 n=1 Tax=Ostrea edulis TaxID=37623 RepID=UPI002094B3A9|nr:uncharacterized protein LOC125645446 isoform X2 [Ostrea edulis]
MSLHCKQFCKLRKNYTWLQSFKQKYGIVAKDCIVCGENCTREWGCSSYHRDSEGQGLSNTEMEHLADPATIAIKTSRRDFPGVISSKLNGGTTVSGTMVVANMAGIQIFVTGGIGGVHHGVQETMDISADLTELGRTPVTVISSGVKSILDIGKTLEYLETEGVAVATYGSSRKFPAFFTPCSGFQVPYNLTNPTQAAHFIESHKAMHLQSGILIGVPIPEADVKSGEIIQQAIDSVIVQAIEQKIAGKDVTPFILERVNEITGGASLQANISLIKNNALVGSQIAYKLSKLLKSKKNKANSAPVTKHMGAPDVVVIGGSIVDFYARVNSDNFQSNGATYAGGVDQSFGGVGRNLADGLTRLGVNTLFISAIGKDSHRAGFRAYCSHMNLGGVQELEELRTATYCAVLQKGGELLFGIGDMDIHNQITPEYIEGYQSLIEKAKMVCIDGNVTVEALRRTLQIAQAQNVPVCFEPTDIHKASKPFQVNIKKSVTITTPNVNELRTMYKFLTGSLDSAYGSASSDELPLTSVLMECILLSKVVVLHVPMVIVSLGKHGVALCQRHKMGKPDQGIILKDGSYLTVDWYPAVPKGQEPGKIISVSGAGDCLASAIISGIIRRHNLDFSIKQGILAAQLSLQSHHAVPPFLSRKRIELTEEMSKQLSCTRISDTSLH